MIDLGEVKKIEWQYLVNRRESLLHRAILMQCYDICSKVTGIPWQPTADFRPGSDILFPSNDFKVLRRLLNEGGIPLLRKFHRRLVEYVGTLDRRVKEWEAHPPVCTTSAELQALLEEFFKLAHEASAFLCPMPIADGVLAENILKRLPGGSAEQQQEWLKVLAFPLKDNEHTREERAFYRLVAQFQAGDPGFEEALQKHLREFAWIGARGAWWELAWSEADVRERVEAFVASGKDPQIELEHLERSRLERKMACEKLYADWKIESGSELDEWIALAKEFAYARTWRTDVIYGAEYRVGFLFAKIARRIGWPLFDMSYLTPDEVRSALTTRQEPISSEELSRRKTFLGTLLLHGELRIFSGEEGKKIVESLISKKEESSSHEVKGSSAFVGLARGRVKIVQTAHDLKKVERGDVLVAVMTFPHFIAAMEKACAFVTDEGGILCHAAIISREMRKPCVIATKHATKIFHDGDMVEVDGEKGMVRRVGTDGTPLSSSDEDISPS